MKHSDTQHPREKSTLVYVDKILPIQRTPKRVRCTCVSMDVHAYILVRMISYLRYECGCVCVCVSVSEYVPRPRRFPLSCILKFALRLFHRTAALSSKARSRLLLPFLSRPIFLLLSVSLFSLHISLAVMLMFLLLFSWGNIHGVAPGYASQTSLPCKHLHTLDILQISVT